MDNRHFVNQHVISPPFPAHLERIIVALGCFGAQRDDFGNNRAFTVPPLDTLLERLKIQLIKKFAQV